MNKSPSSRCYCVALRGASRKLTSIYDEALAPAGITVAQFSLLRKVRRLGPLTITALAELAELDRSTVGRNVRLLAGMGLVAIGAGDDHRQAVVDLTAAGQTTVEAGGPLWDGAQQGIERRLGPERAAQLFDLLEAL